MRHDDSDDFYDEPTLVELELPVHDTEPCPPPSVMGINDTLIDDVLHVPRASGCDWDIWTLN